MSIRREPIPTIPAETQRVAQAAFPNGNLYLQMRDELGSLYTDDMFSTLYAQDGQPAISPWQLALVTVMQFAENLSDRQAADAVRSRIDWKYALSLPLTDEGFDYSVLSEFRSRLVDGEAGQVLLDGLLTQCVQRGWLRVRGQQRTDSTPIMTLRFPQQRHETLQAARLRQATPDFKATYARRAGMEGTFSQAMRNTGLRRTRYRGLQKRFFNIWRRPLPPTYFD